MRKISLFSLLFIFVCIEQTYAANNYVSISAADTTRVTITVNPEILNTFKGIGYNITSDLSMAGYKSIKGNPSLRHKFFESFIKEANFQNLVLWGSKWWYDYETGVLNQDYMTYLKEAVQYGGIKHIIHNPTDKYYPKGLHTPFYEQLDFQTNIAKKLDDAGIKLYGMTYKNKPNTNESGTFKQNQDSVAMGIRLQRKMLNNIGLTTIKMSGPTTVEWHPRNPNPNSGGDVYDYKDGDTELYLNAIIDSVGALDALDAFDKESYGDGMTTWYYNKAKQYKKDLWVMLSATEDVGANDNDIYMPSVVAATLTSDINHGVSIWNTWLSYRLLVDKTLEPKPLYYYLKNVSTKFQSGASIKKCISFPALPTEDMHWNYFNHEDPSNYLQPKISAAACLNPDSTWSVSLVNTTGIHAQHQIASTLPFVTSEARILKVEIDLPELSNTLFAWFSIYKSYPDQVKKVGTAEMKKGKMEIILKSGEHLVLQSDSMSNSYIPNAIGNVYLANSELNLLAYPNPFYNEITFEYQLKEFSDVELSIYDLSGRIIARPLHAKQESGSHKVFWNGTENNGSRCKQGVYVCKIQIRNSKTTIVKYSKVVLME